MLTIVFLKILHLVLVYAQALNRSSSIVKERQVFFSQYYAITTPFSSYIPQLLFNLTIIAYNNNSNNRDKTYCLLFLTSSSISSTRFIPILSFSITTIYIIIFYYICYYYIFFMHHNNEKIDKFRQSDLLLLSSMLCFY